MSPENVYIVLDGWINTLPTLGAAVSVECWSNRLFYLSTPAYLMWIAYISVEGIFWHPAFKFHGSHILVVTDCWRLQSLTSHWRTLGTHPPTLPTSSTSGYPTQLPTYLYIFAVPNVSDTGQGTHFIQPTICFLLLSVPQLQTNS